MSSNINLNNVILTNPDNNFNPYNEESPLPVQISGNTIEQYTDQVKIGSAGALAMYPDETVPVVDDNARPGWSFVKSAEGEKINWFYYGAGNTFTTFGNVRSLSSLITLDAYNNTKSLPFFIVYTKPTGVDDYSWYKSSILYQLSPGENIQLGEGIQAWSGIRPKKQSNLRQVEFNVKSINTLGNNIDIEELYSISIHTESSSAIGDNRLLVTQVGFDLKYGQNKIERRINLI
jgi:hypothetical protein